MTTHLGIRDEFIQNNLGLVHACAGRFRGRGIEYDDLYSAGCMGLIKAYDGFDTSRGVCFPPMRCRSFWAKSKNCSATAVQLR